MNAESFAYWMKGAIELGNVTSFNEQQVDIIHDHLDLVFKKVTPQKSIGGGLHAPITTLPYFPPTRIGDIPTDVAHQATC